MKKDNLFRLIVFFVSIVICTSTAYSGETIVKKTVIINGEPYTFAKKIDDNGLLIEEVRNSAGKRVKRVPRPKIQTVRMGKKLENMLRGDLRSTSELKVNIVLNMESDGVDEKPEMGSGEVYKGYVVNQKLNGRTITEKEILVKDKVRMANLEKAHKQRADRRRELLKQWIADQKVLNQKSVQSAIKNGRQTITANLTVDQIKELITTKDPILLGIELWERSEDDIDDAMDATSISTSAHPYGNTRGDGIGIYMTESGCANEIHITDYDRLSGSQTNHSRNVGAIIREVSPDAYLYCRGGAVLPADSDLDGVGVGPPIHIVTRSNSSNNSTAYNSLDRDWDDFVYEELIATFNSGGNTGSGTGNVRSPGKGLNIITVGNYNDTTDAIHTTSPYVDPETGNDKPEICAPGHTVAAGGFTMTGTSQSTPHAAAFAANMMSRSTYLMYRPYLVKAKILAAGTDEITGGYGKVGLGGIDFATGQWSGYWQYYSGNNHHFNTFDENDGSHDGYITKTIYISSSWDRARVVISWLNRGTYTYENVGDLHPIGQDLDLRVYDPSGRYVGGSYSWDNGFEKVDFTPTVSGYYEFVVNRYANRDVSSNFRLGIYVNYYNE